MGTSRTAPRIAALTAILAIVSMAGLAGAQPAAAIPGLERKAKAYGDFNDDPWKVVTAYCDEDQHVIGGGAQVMDGGRKRVRLVSMWPFATQGVARDGFRAAAEAPSLLRTFDWQIVAYAICADREFLDDHDYEIVLRTATIPSSGGPFAHTTASCPRGTVAYGAGGHLYVPGTAGSQTKGRIGLQMVRTSTPLDISRASGREDAAGFFGTWQLTSFAVCASRMNSIYAEHELATGTDASAVCNATSRVHNAGGGGGIVDGGPVWLHKAYPSIGLNKVDVGVTGRFPDGQVLASATCAF